MRILITGVAGHLGSSFARWLLEHEPACQIVGLDDLSCGYLENIPVDPRLGFLRHDLAEPLPDFLDEPFDYIFHFAAYAAECLSPFIRAYNYRSNLVATANVINAAIARGCRRLVYTSSAAVYGRGHGILKERVPFAEDDICWPHDPYGVAKLACEQDLWIAGEQHGLNWCVLRPHNIYGPGQSLWQKYRNVFGLWMRAAFEHEPITIFGDGQQRRAFTYIEDILPCLWQAATFPTASHQVINLGGSRPITIRDAAAELQAAVMSQLGRLPPVRFAEARHEVRDAWCTSEKSRHLLGYRDETPLRVGLAHMLDWAHDLWQEFPERREQPDPFKLELQQGLYSYWRPATRA